jgi:hypothetical protein
VLIPLAAAAVLLLALLHSPEGKGPGPTPNPGPPRGTQSAKGNQFAPPESAADHDKTQAPLIDLVLIQAGEFMMGASDTDNLAAQPVRVKRN